MGLINRKNKIITAGLAKMLDGPSALRRYLIENVVMQGVTLKECTDRRRQAGGIRAQRGSWGPARLLFMPDGVG